VTGSPSATSGATAGGAYSLSASDFSGGVAYVNITDADAETVSLVASLSSNSSVQASTALTFAAKAATAATVAPKSTTTGWVSTGSAAFSVPQVASVTFAISAGSGQTTVRYPVTVTDVSGKVTGKTGGVYDVAAAPLGTFTVAATFSATSTQNFTVGGSIDTAGANTAAHTFTVAAVNPGAAAVNANITDTVAFTNSALRVAPAGTASFAITVSDQWGNALPNATVTLTWAGRNTSTAATQKTGLTDADGQITLSYTDTALSTVTATADTVTATAVYGSNSSTSTATVNWLATTVGTVTLTSTGDTDTVAGTTKTDISAGVAGATATSATASAVVKDANGVIIVGTPVTFVVSGLVGAEVHTTNATVYTDSTGTAVANISSYAAGKATVKATAGTISATDDVYFSQQTLTEARTIAAVANGGTVTATVTDRYGNPIKGVYVYATRTGTGYFGNGASSSSGTTDTNGQIDFVVTGAATVTVALGDSSASSTTYGQSADAAGKVGTTAITAAVAGTATTNQVGLGAALAPAGVNSVAVEVTGNSQSSDAIDAANEATDAANAATDAANAAAEAADAATAAAQDAQAAVAELATKVATLMAGIKAQITSLTNLVIKIQKKVKA
jgi:protocatechuate 3,4-dioxygenase beta subunit